MVAVAVVWLATGQGVSQAQPPRPLLTPGPAANVSLSLSPSSIAADGQSISTAVATVTDASMNPVSGDALQLTSSDKGELLSAMTSNGPGTGTYTGTVRSSMSPGQVMITASDTTAGVSGNATLTQTPVPTRTFLSAPSHAATNQQVTLTATVSAGAAGPAGVVVFKADGNPISGCSVLVAPTTPIVQCGASFAAAVSSESLTASFVPYSFTGLAGSTSAPLTLAVDKGASTTSLSVSRTNVPIGAHIVYTATVASSAAGPAIPSGLVEFLDNGSLVPACGPEQLASLGTARCTVSYPKAGTHQITVQYLGDPSFLGSTSSPAQSVTAGSVPGPSHGTVTATMQWTFLFTNSYTKIMLLKLTGAPNGGTVLFSCGGRGCPFGRLSPTHVGRRAHKRGSLDLTVTVSAYAFPVGTRLRVAIIRSGWVGKYYRFTVRSSRAPAVMIACLPPGQTRPGGAC